MSTVSKYWKHLNHKSIDLLEEYGYKNFKQTVAKIYNDPLIEEDTFSLNKILWGELYALYSEVPKGLLGRFSEPEIGNPTRIFRNEQLVSVDLGMSISEYWSMLEHIDFDSMERIVEIGGGYGRMPYIIQQLHPNIKYTMCDIEPALGLAKWYLPQVLPGVTQQYVHPEELFGNCDLVIACDCLHEMTRQQVHSYFDYVDKNAKYFYYNCWKDTTMPCDYIRWQKSDYPVKNRWTKIFEKKHTRTNFFAALYKMGESQ